MKYAAKRTWPEKSPSWEHQGEAETMDAFASEFASVEQLGLDTEFVVMEKEGGESRIQCFLVSGKSPYQLTPVEQGRSGDATPADLASDPETAFVPDFRPAVSMIFFMAKVSVGATVTIAILAVIITYIKKAFA